MVPLWFLPFAVATRQHVRPQAVGAGAAVAAADVRAARSSATCRRASSTSSTAAARSSRRSAIIPDIRAVSFVGSTPVARARLPARDARRQARAGARRRQELRRRHARRRSRPRRSTIITESFYGCAGERCLAGSVLVPVGDAHARSARSPGRVGASAEGRRRPASPASTMGPVISAAHRDRVRRLHRPGRRRKARSCCSTAATRVADRPRRLLRRPDGVRRGLAADGDRPRGDLRAGGVDLRR